MTPGCSDSPGGSRALHRTLGRGEVTAGGVGIIIGAVTYVLIGAATAHAGEMVWFVMLTQLEARAVWMGLAVCAAGVIAAFVLRSGNRSAGA